MITYLDYFSGAGGGSLGVHRAIESIGECKPHCAGSFEVEKNAIKIYSKNFPRTKQLGSVNDFSDFSSLGHIDLVIGGSPCTDLSIIKNAGQGGGDSRKGLKGDASSLFFKYLEAITTIKPKYFLLENVASMSDQARDEISKWLGVQPILINSSLVSAQNRSRYYWCNWDVEQPENKFIQLNDIKVRCPFKYGYSWSKSTRKHKDGLIIPITEIGTRAAPDNNIVNRSYDERFRQDGKANCLTGSIGGSEAVTFFHKNKLNFKPRKVFDRKDLLIYNLYPGEWRHLLPVEAERLQTFPDDWCKGVSNAATFKLMGNAMTVDVIAHIISQMPGVKR